MDTAHNRFQMGVGCTCCGWGCKKGQSEVFDRVLGQNTALCFHAHPTLCEKCRIVPCLEAFPISWWLCQILKCFQWLLKCYMNAVHLPKSVQPTETSIGVVKVLRCCHLVVTSSKQNLRAWVQCVCGFRGKLLAEMESNIQSYIFWI